MSTELPVPETKILAIASHVGFILMPYIARAWLIFALQGRLWVTFAGNHTGYGQVKGTKTSADEIRELYHGLKQSYLDDYDMMLSGYIPSAEGVDAVGSIARDLKLKSGMKTGSFFWVLDPVMGDDGRLYVNENIVPAYKNLLREADLILPNQFEAELLSDTKITSLKSLITAVTHLHKIHRIPHILVTSVRLPSSSSDISTPTLSVIGSTARTDLSPRIFRITVPAIDCFFSGTGDMFAALLVVRLREAVIASNLLSTKSWVSPDDVCTTDLPLARAAEKVLASMQAVLEKTKIARDEALSEGAMGGPLGTMEKEKDSGKRGHLRRTKAAEVRIVRNVADLREPVVRWKAE
ncbi:MAG: putative pyridoxal kinase, partial [Candelina submexicana]